jgi:imidazole glycerol-phosphate synthase subunit HisH
MQLLCRQSEEGNTIGMGVFDADVYRFASSTDNPTLKVPQIGWNSIYGYRSPLFNGLEDEAFVYYVHSYYATTGKDTAATSRYGLEYSAALQKDNFYAVQFHVEKSAAAGERILHNFLRLN